MRSAICISAGRSATPAAATLHSVLSTYVEIRPKMAEKGTKTTQNSRVTILNPFLYIPPPHVGFGVSGYRTWVSRRAV